MTKMNENNDKQKKRVDEHLIIKVRIMARVYW